MQYSGVFYMHTGKEDVDTLKVFISQAMNGKTEEEIIKVREQAIENVKRKYGSDVEVIESYFKDYDPKDGCIPLKYLAKAIELLADADLAYFCRGWQEARGCRIENECAKAYSIKTIAEW